MSHRTNPDPTAEIRIETELPPLPPEGKARLRKLIGFLRELPPEKFNFRKVVSEEEKDKHGAACGTVCCAIGWTPALFPDLVKWRILHFGIGVRVIVDHQVPEMDNYPHAASALFGMPRQFAAALFDYGRQKSVHFELANLSGASTANDVASVLEHYIRLTETPRPCT